MTNINSMKSLVVLQQRKKDAAPLQGEKRQASVNQSVAKMVDNFMTRSQSNVLNSISEKKLLLSQFKLKQQNKAKKEDQDKLQIKKKGSWRKSEPPLLYSMSFT